MTGGLFISANKQAHTTHTHAHTEKQGICGPTTAPRICILPKNKTSRGNGKKRERSGGGGGWRAAMELLCLKVERQGRRGR